MATTPDAYTVLAGNPDLCRALRLIALGGEKHFVYVASVLLMTSREGRQVAMTDTDIDWHALYERFRGGGDGSPRK